MNRIAVCLAFLLVGSTRWPAAGPVVVSNTYENYDTEQALKNIPVTFSRIGADGDFGEGTMPSIAGKNMPAQVDVLRRARDGSIRYALV